MNLRILRMIVMRCGIPNLVWAQQTITGQVRDQRRQKKSISNP
jgi:hypothetical protein